MLHLKLEINAVVVLYKIIKETVLSSCTALTWVDGDIKLVKGKEKNKSEPNGDLNPLYL